MRHLTAKLVDLGDRGKGWHYASVGSRGGGPIGFCVEHPPHPTEAEARACYRQYQRSLITLDGTCATWGGCEAWASDGYTCDVPTKNLAMHGSGLRVAHLCDEHLTHEHAVVALGLDGDQAGDTWTT